MELSFPNLGIEIDKLVSGITIFGFEIKFYGIIIGIGMVLALYLIAHLADKEEGINGDTMIDLALWVIPLCVIGARLYYVIFSWDYYSRNLSEIFNIRGGGLAIYGGILTGIVVVFVYGKVKKLSYRHLADLAVVGVILGQALGRWGNFFNCEAFGGFTDSLFAMRIDRSLVNPSMIPDTLNAAMNANFPDIADRYIQVHPTFLYESVANLCVLAIMLIYRPHRHFKGALFCTYLVGYGTGRFFIEGLRTDQLKLWNTDLAVSQCLSLVLVLIGVILWIIGEVTANKKKRDGVVVDNASE